MGKIKNKIALLLLVIFIMNILPTKALAASFTSNIKESESQQDVNNTVDESKIIEELVEKRDGNTKHFLKEDKTYEAVVYPIQVHYMEDGVWKDIDNTLEEAKDSTFIEEKEDQEEVNNEDNKLTKDNTVAEEEKEKADGEKGSLTKDIIAPEENKKEEVKALNDSKAEKVQETENIVKNKNNNFDILFSKNTKSNKLVSIAKDNYKLSWGIADTKETVAEVDSIDETELTEKIKEEVHKKVDEGEEYKKLSSQEKDEVKDVLTENEKIKSVLKAYSTVEFNDIYDGIDLTYDVIGDVVKENFIIKKKIDDVQIKVHLNMENLVPVIQEDKTIIFYDINDKSKEIYKIAAPIMFDDNDESSCDIDLSLEQTKDGYDLSIVPSSEWLNDEDRAYPVKLDPTVETALGIKDIQDTFVCSLDRNNKKNNILVRVGNGGTQGTMRGYFKFKLPTLSTTDMVTSAKLNLYENDASNGGAQVNVHKVLGDWNSSNINWSNKPGYDEKIVDYNVINTSANGWHDFDITSITKEWYESGNNYGLMLKADNEGGGKVSFRSSDTEVSQARPSVSIAYCSNMGLESYWTYHTQDIGRAGNGYVNDYNGNLVLVHNDLSMTGNRMPVTLKHIYNLKDGCIGYDWGYGLGWRLSLQQKVEEKIINNVKYYTYTDEDGTVHYFKADSNNAVRDIDGLELTLNKNGDGSYTIKDKKNSEMNFGSDGFLKEIKDANNNHIVITYRDTPRSKDISTITDGAGRVITLNYNSEQRLASITEPDGSIAASYSYDGGLLKTITYKDGKVSTYNYEESKLEEVIDYTGYRINYDLTQASPVKVKSVKESVTSGEQGGILNIEYGNNITTFKDVLNCKTNIYSFNNRGKTVSVRDDKGNAKYYKYSEIGNIGNKLTTESKLQSTIINLASNTSMENDGGYCIDGWGTGKVEKSSEAYLGSKSMKISKKDKNLESYFEQLNSIEKVETYTVSAYIKTKGVSDTHNGNAGARIVAFVQDKDGNYVPYGSEFIQGDTDWERYSTTFTVPQDSASESVIIRGVIYGESGEAYFDNFQLEKGRVPNRYNLIENGDFKGEGTTPGPWENMGCDNNSGVTGTGDISHISYLSNNVYRITGAANSAERKIKQHVNVSGKKGDVYSIGAWAKAEAVERGKFALEAIINTTSGQIETFKFNSDCTDWQYLSEFMIAKDDYSRIDVYLIYENNVNTTYFDGVQLYKETYGVSYQYDSEGNIISSVDLANKNTKFKYDGNNNLIKSINPTGSNFKYEYDTHKNIIRAESSEGIVSIFEYDQYGNAVEASQREDSNNYLRMSSSYTESGNYEKTFTNSLGSTVTYNYNEIKGNLNSATDGKGYTTNYVYDVMGRITEVSKNVGNSASVNKYTYTNDIITQIKTNGVSYNFNYDAFGKNTNVSVGSKQLVKNDYDNKTSELLKTTYGNGNAIARDYDGYGRIVGGRVLGDNKVGVQYVSHISGQGWQNTVSNKEVSGNGNTCSIINGIKISLTNAPKDMKIKYQVHVSDLGWLDAKSDGEIAGTIDQNNRIEAIRINLEGAPKGYRVRYRAHVEDIGWQDWVQDGEVAGTVGVAKRINEIRIDVDKVRYANIYDANGNLAVKTDYVNDVEYKYTYDFVDRLVRVSDSNGNVTRYTYDENNKSSVVSEKINGKTLSKSCKYDKDGREVSFTVKNDNKEFSINRNYDKLGRISDRTIENGSNKYKISYGYAGSSKLDAELRCEAHVSDKGWMGEVKAGETAGTTGENRAMEAFKLNLNTSIQGMTIKYQAHSSGLGWLDWVNNGEVAGTVGQSRQVEAVKIKLEGAPQGYHVKYQAHVENVGWTAIVQDGEVAGTTGEGKKIEAIRVSLVKDGTSESTNISTITFGDENISYTYDKNGNIETATNEEGKVIKYYYDELNELVREDNEVLNKTLVNSYDLDGNILSRSEYPLTHGEVNEQAIKTITYGYSDNNWKDKLTSFDGKAITYDQIGNPLTYDGWSFTWNVGRDLMSMKKGKDNITYKYDESGVRTEKTVNGLTTKYILSGDTVIYESNEDDEIYYTYDSVGDLVSINLNGDEYFYLRNLQNDIIALVDNNGNKVVEYTYDSFGKIISIDGKLKESLGVKNPYRYRGYRYDNETGLYYIQTRYYNPEVGRFINADSIIGEEGEILKHNIFAYCSNNFVNFCDDNGESGVVIGGIILSYAACVGIGVAVVGTFCFAYNRLIGNSIPSVSSSTIKLGWDIPRGVSNFAKKKSKSKGKSSAKANTSTTNKKQEPIYYAAYRKKGSRGGIRTTLAISKDIAKVRAQLGYDVYTFKQSDAKNLAAEASGLTAGQYKKFAKEEIHYYDINGNYHSDNKWHYHLEPHSSAHIFYGPLEND